MTWYAFRTNQETRKESAELFSAYADAVRYCQSLLQTERRPKREAAGLYKLRNAFKIADYRAYYICRADKMQAYEFADVLDLQATNKPEADRMVHCLKCFEPIPAREGTCPNCGYVEFK